MQHEPVLRTLSQTFRFPGVDADAVAHVLAEAPLIGERGIFGNRTTKSTATDGDTRFVEGFEPVPIPLLRFDVSLRRQRADGDVRVVVEFSQPDRARPYLSGQFVWLIGNSDDRTAAVLQEEINTPVALGIVDRPLHGHRFSLRRWLFFAGGHQRLMKDVQANIGRLLE